MHVVKCMSQNQNLSCFEVFDMNLGSSSVDCCYKVLLAMILKPNSEMFRFIDF